MAASWISEKLDIIPHAQLVQRLEALGGPINIQWGIYALYESVRKFVVSQGLMEAVASTITHSLWSVHR